MTFELSETRARVQDFRHMARRGQRDFSAPLVLADLVEPFLELITAMETKAVRWLTLSEAINQSRRNRKYFEKELASLGGRSRLKLWREEGLAEKADGTIWLIHPRLVEEAKRSEMEAEAEEESHAPSELSPEAIAEDLLNLE